MTSPEKFSIYNLPIYSVLKMYMRNFVEAINNNKNILVIREAKNHIFCRPKFGSKKIIGIPLSITPNLTFLAGVIMGDGHLRKDKFGISIEMISKTILTLVQQNFEKVFLFNVKIKRKKERIGKKQSWKIEFKSKVIWLLFNRLFEIPFGKKTDKIKVPEIIFNSDLICKKCFIEGLFLADGGIKNRKRICFTFSNEEFATGIKKLLEEFDVKGFLSKWMHKNSHKKVFDVIICS